MATIRRLAWAIALVAPMVAGIATLRADPEPEKVPRPNKAEAAFDVSKLPHAAQSGATCTGETKLTPGVPGSPGHLIASKVNPNGDAELGLMMRYMATDLEAAKAAIESGKPLPAPSFEHAHIRCAWPTDTGVRDVAYDGMSIAYASAWKALRQAEAGAGQRAAYGRVVDMCVTCHESFCQGPITRIQKLRLL